MLLVCSILQWMQNNMEIEHIPTKKWYVYDVIKCTFERLLDEIEMRANTNQHPPVLNWCEGVAFFFTWFPMNDFMIEQSIQENKHLAYAFIAVLPEYKKEIVLKSGGHILMMKRDNDPEIVALCKWFREHCDLK